MCILMFWKREKELDALILSCFGEDQQLHRQFWSGDVLYFKLQDLAPKSNNLWNEKIIIIVPPF